MKYRMNILLMSGPRNQATHVALAPIEVGIELGASRAPGKRKLKPMPDDTNPLVRIVSLKLQDIGCFEHIDLYLDRSSTCCVEPMGSARAQFLL